jgi:ThiF family/Prokaryotic homologs of the JAB domain
MNQRLWTSTSMRSMTLTRQVYNQIEGTIGCLAAETGGMLGGDRRKGIVTHFHFDGLASQTGATYSPDTLELNRVLEDEWNPKGVELLGFVHSHPRAPRQPSAGDLVYADQILRAIPKMREIMLPIAMAKPDTGTFELLPFAVLSARGRLVIEDRELVIVNDAPRKAASVFARQRHFARVKGAYDLARLERSRIVAIGCGGSASFLEDMARAGVGEFVLIDPDVVLETNVATQQAYISDVGMHKVDVIAERLRDINPLVATVACPLMLDELDDAAFSHLCVTPLRKTAPSGVLVCGMTDSFHAQARVNRLALNFGLPSLCAQMYAQGLGSEVTFTHPDLSVACHRCILASRYEAYLNGGFVNDVTSDGSPYQSTARLNSLKQLVALALLQHGTNHARWGRMLRTMGRRNLVQVRHDPSCNLPAFGMAFRGADSAMLLCDEAVWLSVEGDSACPECGGHPNLDMKGTFRDTRTMRA